MIQIIAQQEELRPVLPTIEGNVHYQEFRAQLLRIDELLLYGGVQADFVRESLAYWSAQTEQPMKNVSVKQQEKLQQYSIRALRCNIVRVLLQESRRDISCHLADSALLQRFCGIDRIDVVRVPSKSAIDRYSRWLPPERIRVILDALLSRAGIDAKADQGQPLDLAEPIDLETCFVDTTCVKANIHFPVDWVFLRDASGTLMQATELIRRHGLHHRMRPPQEFLSAMNKLCIQMSHARRKSDSNRQRKAILRLMKKLLKIVRGHARRHRDLLDRCWRQTDWTRAQAEQVLRRIDSVLELLPRAIKQAHERIIGSRSVANADKLLSLYERDTRVIIRGKSDAEVEFGNTLLLAELPSGLIADWQLYQQQAPADAQLLQPSIQRLRHGMAAHTLATVVADRGFDSQANARWLQAEGIRNGLCPRSPEQLSQQQRDKNFCQMQKRRAQTEARISIFKNQFLGRPLRAKGFSHREQGVAWGVLAHNLWVLARLPKASATAQAQAA